MRSVGIAAIIGGVMALPLLTSCTSAKPLLAPSGAMGFKVWCELPSQCYEKAAEVCPSGYTIEANEKDYWGLGDFDGNLIIVCKRPGEAAAEAQKPAAADECVSCKKIKSP
jgi:hypothetical protein